MANPLFARKPLSLLLEELKGGNCLRRVLGPVRLTSLGVGAVIGAGIFVTTGAMPFYLTEALRFERFELIETVMSTWRTSRHGTAWAPSWASPSCPWRSAPSWAAGLMFLYDRWIANREAPM